MNPNSPAKSLKQHSPLLGLLLLYLLVATTYTTLIPLGEAPDEPAHLNYARFMAKKGRLPATLEERSEAGYRSTWPPLYHLLISPPLTVFGNTPPTRLKSVGDTPRRLIPTNGQTIAAFIHTNDEAWPWQGITLAWHLARFISVLLSIASLTVTYAIVWKLSHQRWLALTVTAVQAFLPQFLFVSTVLNDDNLLILLSGLVLLTIVDYTQKISPSKFWHYLLLGGWLGLATVAKYNALPLWPVVFIWTIWHNKKHLLGLKCWLLSLVAIGLGTVLTAGWWFVFIWHNFNQIHSQGWLAGSLAALRAGTADATLRQLGSGTTITLPPLALWSEWISTFFQSFWGFFGGGSTIPLPIWLYWLLALSSTLSLITLIVTYSKSHVPHSKNPTSHVPRPTFHVPHPPFLLIPLFFLPLILARFILSHSIVETAQGRHLFPALPLIILALTLGLVYLITSIKRTTHHAPQVIIILPIILFPLSLYSLSLIINSYPPPIPLQTTLLDDMPPQNPIQLTDSITLHSYKLRHTPKNNTIPLTLYWQAEAIPPEDYLIELTLTDQAAQTIGNWVGHPLNGRYPTRAWDKGDILQDHIDVPYVSNNPIAQVNLSLTLLDSSNNPITNTNLSLSANLSIPSSPHLPIIPSNNTPYTYRNTLSFKFSDSATPPTLMAPDGQIFTPDHLLTTTDGLIAHFIVAPYWPSGTYQSVATDQTFEVINRSIQLPPPPMQHTLNANFADQISILGYDLAQQRVEPGQSFPLTLYLQAERTLGKNLVIFNHLLDKTATQRGGADRIPQQYYTTLLWIPGEVVSDGYTVQVDAAAPPGIYWLDVGLYPDDTPTQSLPLFIDGQFIDRRSVSIGPIKVGGPPPKVTISQAQPQHTVNVNFGNQIILLGYDFSKHNIPLTLYWTPSATPASDYTVFIHILDTTGTIVAQADSPPAAGTYPTSLWDSGETIVGSRLLPELPAGQYILRLGLYRPDTGERLLVDGAEGYVDMLDFEVE